MTNNRVAKMFITLQNILYFVLQVILRTTEVMSHIVTNCKIYETSIKFPGDSIVFHQSHNAL